MRTVCRALKLEDGTRVSIHQHRSSECTTVSIRETVGGYRYCSSNRRTWHRQHGASPNHSSSRTPDRSHANRHLILSNDHHEILYQRLPSATATKNHEWNPSHSSNRHSRGASSPGEPAESAGFVFPAGTSLACRMSHRRSVGDTALLSQRHRSLSEAEE